MRLAQVHTPEGVFKVNDQMTESQLEELGVMDKAMLFPTERDVEVEIDGLKSRVEKLESIKQVI